MPPVLGSCSCVGVEDDLAFILIKSFGLYVYCTVMPLPGRILVIAALLCGSNLVQDSVQLYIMLANVSWSIIIGFRAYRGSWEELNSQQIKIPSIFSIPFHLWWRLTELGLNS